MAAPRPGHFYWIRHADKQRPAVVLEVRESSALVVFGTRTQRSRMRVQLKTASRDGRRFGLKETTYFYPDNCEVLAASVFAEEGAPCSADFFLDLRELMTDFSDESEGA